MSLFASDDQNTGASTLVLPVNIQGLYLLRLTGWVFLLSRDLPRHHSSKASILWRSAFFMVHLSQLYVTTGKTIALTIQTFVGRVMSCFSTHCLGLSLLSSKKQLSYYFMAAVTVHGDFGAQEEEICHYFHVLPFYLPCSNGANAMILDFLIFGGKLALHSPPSPSSKGSLVPLHFLPLEWYHLCTCISLT